jgi:hypothetical protein
MGSLGKSNTDLSAEARRAKGGSTTRHSGLVCIRSADEDRKNVGDALTGHFEETPFIRSTAMATSGSINVKPSPRRARAPREPRSASALRNQR